MLILGWRGKVLSPERLSIPDACPRCGKQALRATIVQRYFHVWWIPFVPYAKRVAFACEHCGMEASDESATPPLDEAVSRLQKQVSTPFYMFTGLALALVGFAAIAASFISFATAPGLQERIARPAVGDVYVVDGPKLLPDEPWEKDYKFLVARVITIDQQSNLELQFSASVYNDPAAAQREARRGRVNYKGSTILKIDQPTLLAWYEQSFLRYAMRP
jgi:hypothetical protein